MDHRSNCVKKNLSLLSFIKSFFSFFKKKAICINVDSIRDSDKLQQSQDL